MHLKLPIRLDLDTLANLFQHCRSSPDCIQVVLLCREQDFKYFGQDLIFTSLVKDLEENGIALVDGKIHKATICAIVEDNLGSHYISGFVENFSRSINFCRFCEIDQQTFQSAPLSKAVT